MTAINTVTINPVHSLVALAGEGGIVEAWDSRDRRKCGSLIVSLPSAHGSTDVTAFAYAADGLTFAAGTAGGTTAVFDLRIQSLTFHGVSSADNENASSRAALSAFAGIGPCVIASDRHLCKVFDQRTGETRVNIEVDARVNQLTTFSPDSGLILMACEQPKIQIYYVPLLGPAPRWCAFIDQMTEELEEEQRKHQFDDFKFVTRDDLAKVGLENLLGTSYLRPYMHGYFVDVRLYSKMAAAANPFAFDEYRKQRIKERIEAKRSTRITMRKRAPPAVNAKLAEKLRREAAERDAAFGSVDERAPDDVPDAADLIDSRFRDLFSNPDFELDEQRNSRQAHEEGEGSAEDDRVTTTDEVHRGLKLREMRSERTMHSMAAATAAALRGGSLSEQLRDVVGARDVPLAVRASDEPEEVQPQRIVREMTFVPRGNAKRGRKS
jgi:ribosome biogenesis protein ENP2